MFDIGWSELLLIAVLAIVFVGPKDLPRVMRVAGQYVARMRAMAREFQQSFEDLARESELEELRKEVADLRSQTLAPLGEIRQSVEVDLDRAEPSALAAAGETATEPAGEPRLSERLPDDIAPGIADAIREAEEIEDGESKTEAGRG